VTATDALAQEYGTLSDMIRLHAAEAPRRAALMQAGESLDYGELDALMDRIGAALQRDGVQPGEAVALCGANSVRFAAVFLGALRAGAAAAPISSASTPETVAAMVNDCAARHLFIDRPAAAEIGDALAKVRATRISLDGSDAGADFISWLAPPGSKPRTVPMPPEAPFNIIYSSGTTGTPKGIVQPNTMRWVQMQRALTYGYSGHGVTLLSTPLHSNTTLVSFLPTLAIGGTVLLMAKFDARRYLELAEKHRVTHTMLVPVQYQRIMALPDFDRFDLTSFQAKFSTSAPFASALKADVLKRWPGKLYEFYGMTEGGPTFVLMAHDHPDKLHTVGKAAPGHEVVLIDEEGREVPPGEAGEVVGHSATMMTCYHNQPELTAKAEWRDASGKRYIRTGDIGRFDADGFLVLFDRRKDMIISGGFNIYPSDLEGVVRQHPGVADVSVVGVPSIRWGETPVAFVVAKDPALQPAALLAWTNERVGKYQRLAAVELIDALPRSPIGKVLKRELRERYGPHNG
jgi:long-chain acyl-CoA synthetase